jgi:hypothetical protein
MTKYSETVKLEKNYKNTLLLFVALHKELSRNTRSIQPPPPPPKRISSTLKYIKSLQAT